MTQRLYLIDSHLFENQCTVLSCEPGKEGFDVVVDSTVFFPNKGGQPCDTGVLGAVNVTDVREAGDELILRTDGPLPVGETVVGHIDEGRRLDIMEQHTGEHVLSWCAYKLFDAVNVGFHCALTYATLDLDKPLTPEQVTEMEDMANGLVRQNLAVSATIYDSEEDLAGVPLRKHAEGLIAPIRVVSIEGADSCTCCAPHVHFTGEIGAVKIVSAVAYKSGMRMTFLCGGRALKHFQRLQTTVDAIARKFSTAGEEVLSAVEKQEAELKAVKKEKADLTAKLEEYLTAELKAQAEDVKGKKLLVRLTDTDPKRLRPLALSTLPERGLTLLLAEKAGQVTYVLCQNGLKLDMGEVIPAVNLALGGKGGGRGTLAQGSAPATKGLAETVEQLKIYLRNLLKA
ncbi:MAG: hypothetical protein IJI85_06965 [Clostridia bacterium]|nr:hypothetical protein [Clostridia bacterium]